MAACYDNDVKDITAPHVYIYYTNSQNELSASARRRRLRAQRLTTNLFSRCAPADREDQLYDKHAHLYTCNQWPGRYRDADD